jgi:hypothetical protein
MIEGELFGRALTVRQQRGRNWLRWASAYFGLFAVGLVLAALAWRSAPNAFSIGVAALLLTAVAWMVRPMLGMHLTLFFTFLGDAITVAWFPFTKNLSSRESLLYVADQATISPLELVLGFALVCWTVRHVARRERPIVYGPLFRPLAIFTIFVLFGFVYGVGRGGDLRVAVFEIRPLLYLPIVYFLVSNTAHTARQYRRLLWTAFSAALGQSLLSLLYFLRLDPAARKDLEALGEHGSTVPMNALFVFFIAACLFKGTSVRNRIVLAAMVVPVGWVYLISQRRASIVGFAVALVALGILLLWRQPKKFWKVVPVSVLAMTGYVAAFWNSTGDAAFPAQAVKSVISPSQVSAKDRASDLYRLIENFDLNFTIRENKLTGLGFGQRFLRPINLPDISFFEFYQYIPHNSVLWIWVKTGFFGFATMLYLFGRAMMVGSYRLRRAVDPADVVAVTTGVLFILMFAVFAYVDIAWGASNMVYLGFAFAICVNYPLPAPAPVQAARAANPTERAGALAESRG